MQKYMQSIYNPYFNARPRSRNRLLDRELDRRRGPELAREADKITIEGLDTRRPMRRSGNHRIAEIHSSLVPRHRPLGHGAVLD